MHDPDTVVDARLDTGPGRALDHQYHVGSAIEPGGDRVQQASYGGGPVPPPAVGT